MNLHDELLERFAAYLRARDIDCASVQALEDTTSVGQGGGYVHASFRVSYLDSKNKLKTKNFDANLSELILEICQNAPNS